MKTQFLYIFELGILVVINKAIVSNKEVENLKFYYIDPKVADQMDADGPFNKWAHGQGSFLKSVIEESIHNNRFRGSDYRKNIKKLLKVLNLIFHLKNQIKKLQKHSSNIMQYHRYKP